MGCSHSQYPLPAGKHKHHLFTPLPIDEKEQIPHLSKEKSLTSPKQHLSPLRTTIASDEIARPQSEETARIQERFEIPEWKNTDALDAIKENELFNIPQSCDKENLNRSISREVKDSEESVDSNACNIAKLSESCLIDVLMIEGKIVPLESLPAPAAIKSPVKRNTIELDANAADDCFVSTDSALRQEVNNDIDIDNDKRLINTAHKITFKDRVLFGSAAIFLVMFYIACIVSVGWISLKGIQSARHLIFPVPCRLFHFPYDTVAANALFVEVNRSNTRRTIRTDCGINRLLPTPADKGSQISEVIRKKPISSPSIRRSVSRDEKKSSIKGLEPSGALAKIETLVVPMSLFGDEKNSKSPSRGETFLKSIQSISSSTNDTTSNSKNFEKSKKIKFPYLITWKDINAMIVEGNYFI